MKSHREQMRPPGFRNGPAGTVTSANPLDFSSRPLASAVPSSASPPMHVALVEPPAPPQTRRPSSRAARPASAAVVDPSLDTVYE